MGIYKPPIPKVIPNPDHKRQILLQIYLPLVTAILLGLVFALLSWSSMNNSMIAKWSHLSLIYMILIASAFGLVILGLVVIFIYLLTKLLNITPFYARLVQRFFAHVSAIVRYRSDQIAEPILVVKSWWTGLLAFFKSLGIENK
jgi:hypothetical protein